VIFLGIGSDGNGDKFSPSFSHFYFINLYMLRRYFLIMQIAIFLHKLEKHLLNNEKVFD